MRRAAMLVWLGLAAAAAGCGDLFGPEDDGGNGDAPLSATIDGAVWRASPTPGAAVASRDQGGVAVVATDLTGRVLWFAMPATTTGTYTIGMNGTSLAGYTETSGSTSRNWHALLDKGSGSITLTVLTANRVAGTFQFDVVAEEAGTTPRVRRITNGQFDVPVTQ